MRFVKLEDGEIVIKLSGKGNFVKDGGDDATDEVATSIVRKDAEIFGAEKFGDNFGCGGFAVGARDDDDAMGEFLEDFIEEFWVKAFDDEAWGGGAVGAAEATEGLNEFADEDSDKGHDSGSLLELLCALG